MATTSPPQAGVWSACVAHLYDPVLALGERRGMAARRRALLAEARGHVLEIGAGTGRNLDAYPEEVDALVLTEPDAAMRRRLRRRIDRAGRTATVVDAGAEALPFADASFDTVVSTLVLCTVPDPEAAVRELRRVLRSGGRLLFVEHVRAEEPRLARWQARLAAPWSAFAVGCHCDRPTLDLVRAHFPAVAAERATWRGMPRIVHPLVTGHAEAGR